MRLLGSERLINRPAINRRNRAEYIRWEGLESQEPEEIQTRWAAIIIFSLSLTTAIFFLFKVDISVSFLFYFFVSELGALLFIPSTRQDNHELLAGD
jgi:hypothetical protein